MRCGQPCENACGGSSLEVVWVGNELVSDMSTRGAAANRTALEFVSGHRAQVRLKHNSPITTSVLT